MTTKERLQKLVDDLSEQEAAAALVIVERRRQDPMLQALASAPADDEVSDAEEDAGAADVLAAHGRGESVSAQELRGELLASEGLDPKQLGLPEREEDADSSSD